MNLLKNKRYKIGYTSANGTKSERIVIPTSDIREFVRTIDITELDQSDSEHLIAKQKEYAEYVANYLQTMFDFATWYEHTTTTPLMEKFSKMRSFTIKNIDDVTELDDK